MIVIGYNKSYHLMQGPCQNRSYGLVGRADALFITQPSSPHLLLSFHLTYGNSHNICTGTEHMSHLQTFLLLRVKQAYIFQPHKNSIELS